MISCAGRARCSSVPHAGFRRQYLGEAGRWHVPRHATNACLGFLEPARLAHLTPEGRLLSGDAPTKEWPLHRAIYEARPQAGAVVHLHSTYATLLSCRADIDPDDAIPPLTPYVVMRVGRVPVVPYCAPGSPDIVPAIARRRQSIPRSSSPTMARWSRRRRWKPRSSRWRNWRRRRGSRISPTACRCGCSRANKFLNCSRSFPSGECSHASIFGPISASLWPNLPLLERIDAAARAGFRAVELHWPYDIPAGTLRAKAASHGLAVVGINTPVGAQAGDFGLGAIEGREAEFRAGFDQALVYAIEAGIGAIHVMAGVVPVEQRVAARATFLANLRAVLPAAEMGGHHPAARTHQPEGSPRLLFRSH